MLRAAADGADQPLLDLGVRRAQVGERAVHVERDAQSGLHATYNTASRVESLSEVLVRGWLLILCLILTVWNPASLALRLAASVGNLPSQSWLSIVFLATRLIITSIGVAAGLALFMRRPWAVHLA